MYTDTKSRSVRFPGMKRSEWGLLSRYYYHLKSGNLYLIADAICRRWKEWDLASVEELNPETVTESRLREMVLAFLKEEDPCYQDNLRHYGITE